MRHKGLELVPDAAMLGQEPAMLGVADRLEVTMKHLDIVISRNVPFRRTPRLASSVAIDSVSMATRDKVSGASDYVAQGTKQ